MKSINYTVDQQEIVTLTIDMPGRSANVLNSDFFDDFSAILDRLEAEPQLAGVIVTSGKTLFVAGADIDASFTSDDPADYFAMAESFKRQFRRLELLGAPVVAALNGTALGGGLELALSCHHRIALADEAIRFGFPEVGLGLLPGAGGVVRTVRLIGLQAAQEWLVQNRTYSPAQALEAGMVHALAANKEEMLAMARAWIGANPAAQAPWDRANRDKIPGGGPEDPQIAQLLAIAPAILRRETRGNFPAPHAIMAAMVEGAQVNFETACRIESRYFARLAAGQVSTNMITAFWTQLNQIKKGGSRPSAIPRQPTGKVGVLGAGMMGHGIAYVSALSGFDVVMIDADPVRAEAGRAKIAELLAQRRARRRLEPSLSDDEVLARVRATTDYTLLAGCDLVIEAVFEDRAIKAQATARAEAEMDPMGIFASNTSTLPITGLAQASTRPGQFIGLHFFSPVERMKLVEIIVGAETRDVTLAKAFDYVLSIGKVPIVVNDSRGFFTSRVFGAWTDEGMTLLAEGQHPQAIEMAALQAGMPVGPLAIMDELSLSLADHVRKQALADADEPSAGVRPADVVLDTLLALGRAGRVAGRGFYDYDDRDKRLWEGLQKVFMRGQPQLQQQEMIDRILFIQSIETVRCLEEGVLHSVADANLGAILGWGYPSFHGGPLQFINATGLEPFIRRAQELATTAGERFAPPALLFDMLRRQLTF